MTTPNEFDDEFAGIFDDLTPQHFVESFTTASTSGVGFARPPGNFDAFVADNIRQIRVAYMACDGQLNPVAHLVVGDRVWVFTATDDENLGEYVERLHSEAKRLDANWLFISRKTLVGAYQSETNLDVTDPTAVEEAIRTGILSEGVFYFAQSRDFGAWEYRHGMMRAGPNHVLNEPVEGDPSQGAGLFMKIMGDDQ